MPFNCNTLPTEEERDACFILQRSLAAVRAVPRAVPGLTGTAASHHAGAVGHLVAAEHDLLQAAEALGQGAERAGEQADD